MVALEMSDIQSNETSEPVVEKDIEGQRARIIFEDSSVLLYASNIPFGLFYVFVFCGFVPEVGVAPLETGLLWFGAIAAQSFAGMIVAHAYHKQLWTLSARSWILLLMAIWGAAGVIWGSLNWIMWLPDNPINHALLVVVTMGVEVMIYFSVVASFPVLCVALLATAIVSVSCYLLAAGPLASIFTVAAPLFTVLLIYFGYRASERYREVFEILGVNAKLAQNFEQERDKAEAASIAKSEFLATMSHEIRTPMNGVLGFASLLINSRLDETQRDYVQSIKESGDNLLSIINDILDISKIEAGALVLDSETFSLRSVIESVLSLQRPKAQAKGLDLAMHIDPEMPNWLLGDSGRVRQMLMNFVGNAVKFTESGSIAVVARASDEAEVREGYTNVIVEIMDTGIGIPEDKMETLFDRFTQVDSSRTRRFGGTGLGLAISKELAGAMGGTVCAESRVGEGSVFKVAIPFETVGEREKPDHKPNDFSFAGRSVLVVDDIALNHKIFELMLGSRDLSVTSVSDSTQALSAVHDALAEKRPFDAAIIDHMMPGLDGLTLAQQLKSDPLAEQLPLILSSSSDLVSEAEANQHGFVARAAKPIREAEIFGALKIAFRNQPANKQVVQDVQHPSDKIEKEAQFDEGPSDTQARVLLVDDNAVNQQLVLAALAAAPITVDVAHDGIEAVAAVKAFPYDLVLMDIQMPNMNGIEATRKIRSLSGPTKDIPIVAMTADAMSGDKERFLKAGMNDYIAKPLDLNVMLAKVDQFLGFETEANTSPDVNEPPAKKASA